jgi:hypothetical protein
MKLRRRTFLQFAGAGVAAPAFSRVAVAQTYPTLPVPGGPQTPPLIEEILMALYELRTYTSCGPIRCTWARWPKR